MKQTPKMNTNPGVTERFIDSAGVQLRYIEKGSGNPVILVHGYSVDLEFQWVDSGVFDSLASNFQVFAYDNRGHGKSQKFYSRDEYGIELANDVFRFMDARKIEKAHIVGYSMGAMIVARCLAMKQGRFLSATLGGGAGRFSITPEDRAQFESDARDMKARDLKAHILRLWPNNVPKPSAIELERLNEDALSGRDVEALACARVSMEALVVPLEDLAATSGPMLGIVGTADPFKANLERLKEAMPSLELVMIADASHASCPSTPEFRAALKDFLLRHSCPPV